MEKKNKMGKEKRGKKKITMNITLTKKKKKRCY